MKLFIVAAVLGACLADRLENKYLPPRGNSGAGYDSPNNGLGGGFGGPAAGGYRAPQGGYNAPQGGYNAPQGGYNAPQGGYNAPNSRPQDAGAQILRLNSDVQGDHFSYDFETSNGIRADASGVATNGVQSQGSFAYKGDDGQDYSITYTADENGYQPQGAHLPTPPPIPEAILKSLEQNARDEAAGISDDGSYRGEGAGSGGYGSSGAGAYSGAGGYPSGRPFGSGSGSGSSSGGAASRQYLTPNRGSGNGNFNAQSGYRY